MLTEALITQFGMSRFVLIRNTAGLTQAESIRAPREGGNCVNWVVGHILATRNSLLRLLDEKLIWTDGQAKMYERGSDAITEESEAILLDQMLADIDTSQGRIEAGLKKIGSEQLAEKAPFSPLHRDDETVGSLIATLSFHESYHAGQTGVLRHILGKDDRLT